MILLLLLLLLIFGGGGGYYAGAHGAGMGVGTVLFVVLLVWLARSDPRNNAPLE